MKLRQATLKDLDLLVLHRRRMWESFADFTQAELDRADPVYRRWLRQRLASGSAAGFILEGAGGRPLSSGVVWLQETQPRPAWNGTQQAYVMSIFTEPRARGRGAATRITRATVAWAKERGVERMSLHASRMGYGVYRRIGFERTREMRCFTRGRPRRRGSRRRRPRPPRKVR